MKRPPSPVLQHYLAEPLLAPRGHTHVHLAVLWAVVGRRRVVQVLLKGLHPRQQLRDSDTGTTTWQDEWSHPWSRRQEGWMLLVLLFTRWRPSTAEHASWRPRWRWPPVHPSPRWLPSGRGRCLGWVPLRPERSGSGGTSAAARLHVEIKQLGTLSYKLRSATLQPEGHSIL